MKFCAHFFSLTGGVCDFRVFKIAFKHHASTVNAVENRSLDPNVKFFQDGGYHYDLRYFRGNVDSEITREILLKLLRDFSKTCYLLGVTPILMHGGLIGWYWCRKLLPWDNDLDLCVRYDDLLKLDACVDHERFYDVRHYLLEVNPHHVRRETFNRHPFENRDPNKIDARFIHVPTGLFIDITALSPIGDGDLITKCPHRYRTQDLFPLEKSEVDGIGVYVPNQVEAVLSQEYGLQATTEPQFQDWRINALTQQWERF